MSEQDPAPDKALRRQGVNEIIDAACRLYQATILEDVHGETRLSFPGVHAAASWAIAAGVTDTCTLLTAGAEEYALEWPVIIIYRRPQGIIRRKRKDMPGKEQATVESGASGPLSDGQRPAHRGYRPGEEGGTPEAAGGIKCA